MPVNPANPPQPALRAADKETFAHFTAKHRWRDIVKKGIDNIRDSLNNSGIDKNEEGKKIMASMEELINQIQRNDQLTQIEDDGRPDILTWTDALNTYFKGENWFTASWLFAECYLYRRIISIITNTKHWRNYDPYFRQKEESFKLSFSGILEFSKRIDELISSSKVKIDDSIIFYELAQISLWGNATDLSMLPNFGTDENIETKRFEESKKNILVNDLEKAWKWLSKYSNARVDFILDNAGFELYSDLIFSDWLIQSGYVSEVHLHIKPIPWFVSDTTLDDFNWLFKTLKSNDLFSSASETEKSSLEKLVDRWQSKLVYDCKWETVTPFKEAIGPLANSKNALPVLSLRTGKSDVFVGLDEGVEERLGPDKSWMYSGKYAAIQFSEGSK
ncbi:16585_t:CDS:2 [Dentiscutata erythropus]|uniref:Sugar phosphate phosphatase n=1 Tax=Dentiscutata erythropus TaxID=1348616 RepID=A0A9N9IN10_9GLOM|nr:16585_t:CDS:2 [Dentiscutata erythropus]